MKQNMKLSDFTFELPASLIAQTPAERRGEDRLLVIDRRTGEYKDEKFCNIVNYIDSGSLVVVNNTRVRKARVYGVSETGGRVQFLFADRIDDERWTAIVSRSRKQTPGKRFVFFSDSGEEYCRAVIEGDVEDGDSGSALKVVKFSAPVNEDFFRICGHVPLPPYIKREDDFNDETRYQTIYAKNLGSLASPTAGLHLTDDIFNSFRNKGIDTAEVTLSVGMGTFLPVRTENIEDHVMHTEHYSITPETADKINAAKRAGRKIVSVGTTSLRTLESACDENGVVRSGMGKTNLFITPGYAFKVVDELLTNFHTPESTLLMLVSAFAGRENILRAYKHAVEEGYRFFSYGDATFLK